jgi:hypothetical protein
MFRSIFLSHAATSALTHPSAVVCCDPWTIRSKRYASGVNIQYRRWGRSLELLMFHLTYGCTYARTYGTVWMSCTDVRTGTGVYKTPYRTYSFVHLPATYVRTSQSVYIPSQSIAPHLDGQPSSSSSFRGGRTEWRDAWYQCRSGALGRSTSRS